MALLFVAVFECRELDRVSSWRCSRGERFGDIDRYRTALCLAD